jgi:hypothetical protein
VKDGSRLGMLSLFLLIQSHEHSKGSNHNTKGQQRQIPSRHDILWTALAMTLTDRAGVNECGANVDNEGRGDVYPRRCTCRMIDTPMVIRSPRSADGRYSSHLLLRPEEDGYKL